MNNANLTDEAYAFLVQLYCEYLNRLKNGMPASQAVVFSNDLLDGIDEVFATEPEADDFLHELSAQNFVTVSIGGTVVLTRSAIRVMESRFGNNVAKILEFIRTIR